MAQISTLLSKLSSKLSPTISQTSTLSFTSESRFSGFLLSAILPFQMSSFSEDILDVPLVDQDAQLLQLLALASALRDAGGPGGPEEVHEPPSLWLCEDPGGPGPDDGPRHRAAAHRVGVVVAREELLHAVARGQRRHLAKDRF